MTHLSVNVNKLATIRNARGKNNPDLVATSLKIVSYGAEGITVHPRPDERHIRRQDVYDLKAALIGDFAVELNIEGYPSDDFLAMNLDVSPGQCTLVPDPPEVLTSNAGWLVKPNLGLLAKVAERLKPAGIRTSVFVDPQTTTEDDYQTLAQIGIDRVELYTERYAEAIHAELKQGDRAKSAAVSVIREYRQAAEWAQEAGLGVNAGHDLSLENLERLVREIPWVDEVSIGHALICDALEMGLKATTEAYLQAIRRGAQTV